MASIAVFVALGGSSYAAVKISGKDVRNNSLTGKDIRNSSLTTGVAVGVRIGSSAAGENVATWVERTRDTGGLRVAILAPDRTPADGASSTPTRSR